MINLASHQEQYTQPDQSSGRCFSAIAVDLSDKRYDRKLLRSASSVGMVWEDCIAKTFAISCWRIKYLSQFQLLLLQHWITKLCCSQPCCSRDLVWAGSHVVAASGSLLASLRPLMIFIEGSRNAATCDNSMYVSPDRGKGYYSKECMIQLYILTHHYM